MSIKLLSSLDAVHTVLDDLESFFWLVLHVSIRVVPIQSRILADVNAIMKDLFHTSSWNSNTRSFFGGGYKEYCLFIDGISASFSNLEFTGNKALDLWYKVTRLALRASLSQPASSEGQSEFNHDFMAQQFRAALDSPEWSNEPLIGSQNKGVTDAKDDSVADDYDDEDSEEGVEDEEGNEVDEVESDEDGEESDNDDESANEDEDCGSVDGWSEQRTKSNAQGPRQKG
jgi:hypothetical protein